MCVTDFSYCLSQEPTLDQSLQLTDLLLSWYLQNQLLWCYHQCSSLKLFTFNYDNVLWFILFYKQHFNIQNQHQLYGVIFISVPFYYLYSFSLMMRWFLASVEPYMFSLSFLSSSIFLFFFSVFLACISASPSLWNYLILVVH